MEPTYARSVLPCVDEPARKAIFIISVIHDPSYAVWSNGAIDRTEILSDGRALSHFTPTLKMSTFLLALIVAPISDFACRPDRLIGSNNTISRVCGRVDILPQLAYADEVAYKTLGFFNTYFDSDYPLSKIEHFAVPDFGAGAVENYGLLIYREIGLFFDEKTVSASRKQYITTVISHEIAHQWFGNLVSPAWWGELWLKEGFASYMETLAADFVEPLWMQEEQFVVEKIFAFMEPDSFPTSRPISIDSTNPADIFQMFDSITYDKGATLIRMMSMFLGAEIFQRGVRTYLKALSFSSATQQDLWTYFSQATNNTIDVERIMDGWTKQAGYPIVEVNRVYNTVGQQRVGGRMVISQRPFSLFSTTTKQDKWWIPFKYFDQTFPQSQSLTGSEVVWLNDTSATLNITTADSDWVLANPSYLGIYRTKYDPQNFRLIVTQLQTDHTRIPTITRGALIDDTFALSRTGLINATDAYELIRYLKSEIDFVPWIATLSAMNQQEELLADRDILIDVQRYFLELVLPIYNTIGWVANDQSTEWLRTLLQPSILSAACHYDHPECIEAARSAYRRWNLNPTLNQIPANLRSIVYCTVVREGSRSEFNFLWARLQIESIASETWNLLEGLACTKDPSLIVWFLDQHLTNGSVIRNQDSLLSIENVARSPAANRIAWNWIRDYWSILFEKWGKSDNTLGGIIEAVSSRFVTVRQRDEFKTFADSIIDKDLDFFTIILNRSLQVNEQPILTLNYVGELKNDTDGFYISSYVRSSDKVRRYLVASQMEPIAARRALPCFDEPTFKATFTITVEHEQQYRAWSNMPIESSETQSNGWLLTQFQKTVPMSSYLLALVVADFDCLTRSNTGRFQNITTSVCAQSEKKDDLNYALEIATQSIRDFEEQYQINYPLPKCDHIAVPDFDAGAMENFGCILYRETRLFYNNRTSSSSNKQSVALVIAHELAHQWFGNLVSPAWWDDLWLNEGFAAWMQFVGTNKVHPTWDLYQQFIAQQWLAVMQDDAVSFSHPVNMKLTQNDQLTSIFDDITYSKGSSLLRMMGNFMSEETFNKGVTRYLERHLYSTATQIDLWRALGKQMSDDNIQLPSNTSLDTIMSTWTNQMGYPYVRFESAYIVWERIIAGLSYIEQMIASKSSDLTLYEQFQSYMIDLIFPIYTQLGWQQQPSNATDKWLDTLHRNLIVSTACRYNLDDCVQHARLLFEQWFNQPSNNSIEPNHRSIVYCTIVRLGSRAEFQFLLRQYQESNDPQEKASIQSALACTRDTELIRYLLEIHVNSQLNIIRRQDTLAGIRAICRNFIAETECWTFVRSRWRQLFKEFGGSLSFVDLIKDVTARFNTEQQLDEFERFFEQTIDTNAVEFRAIIERIRANTQWMEKAKPNLAEWFMNRTVTIRLPFDWIPSQYELNFDVRLRTTYPNNAEPDTLFMGHTRIIVRCNRSTNEFRIHMKQLQMSSVTLKHGDTSSNLIIDWTWISQSEILICRLRERCATNEDYVFETEYTTELSRDMAGFYLSRYNISNTSTGDIITHNIAATHMQPTIARTVFPCFDEPVFKAKFNISITHDPSFTVVRSNGAMLDGGRPIQQPDGRFLSRFEETPPMSTYLIAFVLTDFECVSRVTSANIEVNVCGRPEAILNGEGDFALEVSTKLIPYYEQSYNISYPISKCDHFALPDFAIGKYSKL
ncbi:unnamed protein product [Rotaria sordida]|uniref:Aminopeptidase N n=1 Tax=Rotaria sordida TaxID=392033 RepID=A0A818KD75_9BILA|nr:unnamed protein product [Rotaria sordida]